MAFIPPANEYICHTVYGEDREALALQTVQPVVYYDPILSTSATENRAFVEPMYTSPPENPREIFSHTVVFMLRVAGTFWIVARTIHDQIYYYNHYLHKAFRGHERPVELQDHKSVDAFIRQSSRSMPYADLRRDAFGVGHNQQNRQIHGQLTYDISPLHTPSYEPIAPNLESWSQASESANNLFLNSIEENGSPTWLNETRRMIPGTRLVDWRNHVVARQDSLYAKQDVIVYFHPTVFQAAPLQAQIDRQSGVNAMPYMQHFGPQFLDVNHINKATWPSSAPHYVHSSMYETISPPTSGTATPVNDPAPQVQEIDASSYSASGPTSSNGSASEENINQPYLFPQHYLNKKLQEAYNYVNLLLKQCNETEEISKATNRFIIELQLQNQALEGILITSKDKNAQLNANMLFIENEILATSKKLRDMCKLLDIQTAENKILSSLLADLQAKTEQLKKERNIFETLLTHVETPRDDIYAHLCKSLKLSHKSKEEKFFFQYVTNIFKDFTKPKKPSGLHYNYHKKVNAVGVIIIVMKKCF